MLPIFVPPIEALCSSYIAAQEKLYPPLTLAPHVYESI